MSRLFELFTSEYVRITLKKNSKQSIEHNDNIKTVEHPAEICGYFTEEDEEYYFLGIEQDQVNIAISKADISTVEMCEPNDIRDELLHNFGEPASNKKDMN